MDDKDIVSSLRTALTERVGAELVALWLKHEDALHYHARQLTIRATDAFSLERLRRALNGHLALVAESVCGIRPELVYVVDERLKPKPAEKPSGKSGARYSPQQKSLSFTDDEPSTLPPAAEPVVTPIGPVRTPVVGKESAAKQKTASPGRKFAKLESFVVGEGNRLAHVAANSLQHRLGEITPFYVYGPSGCGKTHLLEGIWSQVRRNHPQTRCVYLAAEQFTTMFVEALHGKGLPSFRRKYREVDLLVIDDIQFLHGKRATLQELLAAVDFFTTERKQLVLAADRAPAALPGVAEELTTRLCGGLVVEIRAADADVKRAILERCLAERKWHLTAEVIEFLANELPSDIRFLQGAINRLETWQRATGEKITVRFVRETCRDLLPSSRRIIQLEDIERAICDVFQIPAKSLQSSAKARYVVQPRTIALWLSRKYTRAGLTEIGEHFGLKSHSTVIAASKKVEQWLTDGQQIQIAHEDFEIQHAIKQVETALRTG